MQKKFRAMAAALGVAALMSTTAVTSVRAESIQQALALAYANNPSLNAARAGLRGADESVPQALAGWRPTVSASASAGGTRTENSATTTYQNNASLSLSMSQALFNGFKTVNSTKQAEAIIRAQRESLIATEQDVLLAAAQAYVDVIRDTALVSLSRSDLEFLNEQVRAADDRFDVGEGTRTDVSQADARRSSAQASLNASLAQLNASRAIYRQIVGVEANNLSADTSIGILVPKNLDAALATSETSQPVIRQAVHLVDAGLYGVKVAEGTLMPTVSLSGSLSQSWATNSSTDGTTSASFSGRVSIPIYQGGSEYSAIRQAKESLGQARLQLDVARDQVRANVISAWGNYQAAEASISAAQAAVQAQQLALEGVLEEQRVGQRTTLDVLDAQRELVSQRVSLVTAQRTRIVSGYQLLAAVGKLDAGTLGLNVKRYDPTEHYKAVRNKWFGVRTPDGR
ncbi:TolC family outer membrane protein [Roseibium aestuarii]|uniref:TolC family outer membrane protein n=1 Tax=Roseibium aestuarii TaxID=2600299 RepID=A0ABW4JTF0_9HYPH|nr:TolC family outer membrane protein [Roseibium aestuarii]